MGHERFDINADPRLLDQVFKMAEKRGIAIMLCLLNHGAFSTSVTVTF